MVVAIEAFDAVAVRRAKVFEAAVFEGMIEVKAPIVGAVVAVPMVIVNVWNGVYVTGLPAFGFRLSARFAARGRRQTTPSWARQLMVRWRTAAI